MQMLIRKNNLYWLIENLRQSKLYLVTFLMMQVIFFKINLFRALLMSFRHIPCFFWPCNENIFVCGVKNIFSNLKLIHSDTCEGKQMTF